MSRTIGDLRLTFALGRSEVVVGVHGQLDLFTTPDLAAIIDAVVDRGHARVVLDLHELSFIDATGLRVIANTSDRLIANGGILVLRSTPTLARGFLNLTGVSKVVEYEPERTPELANEQSVIIDPSHIVPIVPRDAPPDLARIAGIPANLEVVDAALRLVVTLTRATVDGANGVSVSLSRHGQFETVASTDETIAQMDRDQYETGEGPCLSAATEGHWFHVQSLLEENRWPRFTPRAIESGIASILSTPLLVATKPVGALNIYSRADWAFGVPERELAALFASQASGILTNGGVEISTELAGQRLQSALYSREVIGQAQGVIMERDGISAEQAYATLRHLARSGDMPIRHTAVRLVASTFRPTTPVN